MATVSYSNSPSGRASGPTFRVSTREISLDFSNVGPAESPNELGALNETAFRDLLRRFASIPSVKLLDGDPQLVVSAKRGRYLLVPSGGQLLVRPANDTQQPFVKFAVENLPGYLDSTDQQPQAPSSTKPVAAATSSTSTNPAAEGPARDLVIPDGAPIYGNIPVSRPSATPTPVQATATAPASKAQPVGRRGMVYGALVLLVLALAGVGWIFYGPVPEGPAAPARLPSDFDAVSSAELLASLKKRYVGTYATSGDAGERLLELRPNGTFHYQEFGAGVATTANRRGTYTFALRHDTKAPLIRASGIGTIELRDDKNLLCEGAIFSRVP